ncbi:MAG: hypothetical protein KJO66_00480, partial [Gammaproteobacteria bacterium]|nr:hypothetical protein [Gammaproteobacteria bacterium]
CYLAKYYLRNPIMKLFLPLDSRLRGNDVIHNSRAAYNYYCVVLAQHIFRHCRSAPRLRGDRLAGAICLKIIRACKALLQLNVRTGGPTQIV